MKIISILITGFGAFLLISYAPFYIALAVFAAAIFAFVAAIFAFALTAIYLKFSIKLTGVEFSWGKDDDELEKEISDETDMRGFADNHFRN